MADDSVESAPGVGILSWIVSVERGWNAPLMLINKSIWATVVVGKSFVYHEKDYAGKECKSQAYENSDL